MPAKLKKTNAPDITDVQAALTCRKRTSTWRDRENLARYGINPTQAFGVRAVKRPLARSIVLLVAFAAATLPLRAAQTPELAASVVERAGRYVEEYEKAFAAVVSEERQVQRLVGADGRVKKTRELRSDFLLIKTGPAWAQVFRDVIAVDGKVIRDRDERLRKLFLGNTRAALEQATAITRESIRHNIGINRQGNSPLVPLIFLHPKQHARSRFTVSGDTIAFEEFETPSLLGTRRGATRFNLLARGSLVVDPASGRVLAGHFTAIGPLESYSASLAVRYTEDPQLKLMVPTSVRERYWFENKPKEDRLEVQATYTNFRRFQVTTTEEIKKESRDQTW